MTKAEISKLEAAHKKWEDTVTEEDVMQKFNIGADVLRKYRRDGKIKNFRYLFPSSTNNPKRPGRKPVYSLVELSELFSATV